MVVLLRAGSGICWCLGVALASFALLAWPNSVVFADEPVDPGPIEQDCYTPIDDPDQPMRSGFAAAMTTTTTAATCGGNSQCDQGCTGGEKSNLDGTKCTDKGAPNTLNANICYKKDANGNVKACCQPCVCKYKDYYFYSTCNCT